MFIEEGMNIWHFLSRTQMSFLDADFRPGYVAALQPNVDNVGLIRNTVLEAAVLTGDIVDGHRMRWRAVERFGVVLFNKTTSQIGYQHPGPQTTFFL